MLVMGKKIWRIKPGEFERSREIYCIRYNRRVAILPLTDGGRPLRPWSSCSSASKPVDQKEYRGDNSKPLLVVEPLTDPS